MTTQPGEPDWPKPDQSGRDSEDGFVTVDTQLAKPSYRFEGGDVPGAFVNIMNGAMEGTVWVPIETLSLVFPQVLERFVELPLWALTNERRDVWEFCSALYEQRLVAATEDLLELVCEALPSWQEAGLSIVVLSKVIEEETGEGIQVVALHESDYESIEQAHGFEAGTLRKWREKYEEINEAEKQRRGDAASEVADEESGE